MISELNFVSPIDLGLWDASPFNNAFTIVIVIICTIIDSVS